MSRSDRPWPIQGNTTGGPLAAAAHWLCKGLTAYNPSDRHPVLSAGPQVYHSDPARRSWRETCRGPLRSGWVRAARFIYGKRESLGAGGVCRPRVMALSPVRSRPRECTCCAGYSVFKVPRGKFPLGVLFLPFIICWNSVCHLAGFFEKNYNLQIFRLHNSRRIFIFLSE